MVRADADGVEVSPLITFVTVATDAKPADLDRTALSLQTQRGQSWQWLLVEGAPLSSRDERHRQKLQTRGAGRIESLALQQATPAGVNTAIERATGEWLAFLTAGSCLEDDALDAIADTISSRPDVDMLYGDDGRADASGINTTPEFSPERLLAEDYVSTLAVYRRSLVQAVGMLRPEYAGVEHHDLALRATEKARSVVHVPHVLWSSPRPRRSATAPTADSRVVEDALRRRQQDADVSVNPDGRVEVRRLPRSHPLVSLVIPTNGTAGEVFGEKRVLVENAIESVRSVSSYERIEFVVVFDLDTPKEVLERLEHHNDVVLIPYEKPFNFADKCNRGVAAASGDVLVLLNDDTQVITPDWLERMLGILEDSGVGAVGPLLRYEDGLIQSGGHTAYGGRVANITPLKFPLYSDVSPAALECSSERSGVTGACMMVERDLYLKLGGMAEEFYAAYNDVDFCYRLLAAGYRVVWTPFAELFHFDHMTRRDELAKPEELALLRSRWSHMLIHDPYVPVAALTGSTIFHQAKPRTSAMPQNDVKEQELLDAFGGFVTALSFQPPRYIEESAWFEHGPFAAWLTETLRPRVFVELGTHGGFSYFAFCQAMASLPVPTKCYAVDHWKGDEHAGFDGNEIFEQVRDYNNAHYSSFSRLVRSSSDDALHHFSDGSVDLLHIDGRHRYDDVKHDFEAWMPKLSDRAVVIFHDVNVREGDVEVYRLWEEVQSQFPTFEFSHGHGLGVLGFGADVAPQLQGLFDLSLDATKVKVVREMFARLGRGVAIEYAQRLEREEFTRQLAERDAAASAALAERDAANSAALAERDAAASAALAERDAANSAALVDLAEQLNEALRADSIAQAKQAELAKQLNEALSAKSALLEQIKLRDRRIRHFERSSSWKITTPLRLVGSFARRLVPVAKPATVAARRDQDRPVVVSGESAPTVKPQNPVAIANAFMAQSVQSRLSDLAEYQAHIDRYCEIRAARRAAGSPARFVVYTAIVGGYDTLKLPTQFHDDIDYVVFTDQPIVDVGAFEIRPVTFFHEDPTRTARHVKTHPHHLLPEYEVAIWIDSNIMIVDDIMPIIEGFEASGKVVGGVPHPLRSHLYDEFEACVARGKDDTEVIREQEAHYRELGFTDDELIESNLMMLDLTDDRVAVFLNHWWSQIDRFSRRDQLSVSHALRSSELEMHFLTPRPQCVRDHESFNMTQHDHGESPARHLLEALRGHVVDPYQAPAYSDVRSDRIAAQSDRVIDVVVCVHNALDDVRACLESVAATRGKRTSLILVDDCSEPPTAEYLASFAQEHTWASLYRNEVRQGYTKSANRGLAASQAEMCILLNSDTIATDGFAEKMADALFSTPGAGIVGPLSNAASHQSIPDHVGSSGQTAVNELPEGMTAEDLNAHCESVSKLDILPRVSLVHGFCLGVSRAALESVGAFDEENFPDGYGEENDFCFRAINAGFGLVVATHTYVFHSKSKSYGSETRLGLAKAGSEAFHRLHGTRRIKRAVMSVNANPLLEYHRDEARLLISRASQGAS